MSKKLIGDVVARTILVTLVLGIIAVFIAAIWQHPVILPITLAAAAFVSVVMWAVVRVTEPVE